MSDAIFNKKLLKKVDQLHQTAREIGTGSIKTKVGNVSLKFDGRNWVSLDPEGYEQHWNTRQITVAKKWVKEYYNS